MLESFFFQQVDVPMLETERLRLRGHGLSDFVHCSAMWADPKVTQHIGGKPLTEEECWTRLLRYVGHWALLGFGYWVVEEKATGHFVGEAGFADYKRDLEPTLKGVPEIGWVFAAQAHGKGYATEAVRAAVVWGDVHFSSPGRTGARTACIIAPENVASIRVAVKCGYRELARTTYNGRPTIMFVREPGA
ncbi:MAG TPA: GNAT family N-acetyltransferase [Candidatus Sulfotelmatobacter sp.]|jgi:RimJ/RimL family protein N-acetyltransferase|nr:GNAT family N-acetyltransferase [Candidatus Sulfotelmatobacter sp.]